MPQDRVFPIDRHLQPISGEPIRSIVTETLHASIVAWHVEAGQRIAPHVHPCGQDSWTVISGRGDYQVDAEGRTVPISAGDIVVAPMGAVHGVINSGQEPLVFVSVVTPAEAGFEPL